MSNENKKVIDMTSENNEANTSNELTVLRESNDNLIAERETLMAEVKQLKEKLEDESAAKNRAWKYWQDEEKKVQFLLAFIESGINGSEYMNASEFVKKLVKAI